MPGKPKGLPKTGGRKPGSQNKATAEIKEIIREALEEAHECGAKEYLKKQAKDNPTAFMTLIGKIIPADVNAKIEGNFTVRWEK